MKYRTIALQHVTALYLRWMHREASLQGVVIMNHKSSAPVAWWLLLRAETQVSILIHSQSHILTSCDALWKLKF